MGHKLSWIARAGTSTEGLLELSDRSPTGQRFSDPPEDGFYWIEMPSPNPWVVLLALGYDVLENIEAEQAKLLSQEGGKTLFFQCVEAVMTAELTCFENGAQTWAVAYSGENGLSRPQIAGDIPPEYHNILKALEAQQHAEETKGNAQVDFIYELPAELGVGLTGFHHDAPLEAAGSEPYQGLAFDNETAAASEAPQGPLSELLRQLFFSGCLRTHSVQKEEDRLTVGAPELHVVAIEGSQGEVQLTFQRKRKTSTYRGSVADCSKKIDAFLSSPPRSRWKFW